jgi:adenylate cyclase
MDMQKMLSKNYAICFADIAGSTRLYERVGDDVAKTLIVASQTEIAAVVNRMGGFVQEIVGDEVMFHFEDVNSAVACACEIHQAIESLSGSKGIQIAVRIGLHFGPVIVEQDRMFGDTINVAARMAGIAQGGQIITTEQVINNLTEMSGAIVRRFDEVRVKGKEQALPVYEVVWQQTDVTVFSHAVVADSEPVSVLVLEYRQRSYRLHPWQGTFTIGRNTTNDLVVMADPVSRSHATIEFSRGHFLLADISTNGTYLQKQNEACIFFRREATPLLGRGQIGFGAPLTAGTDHVIDFNVE